MSILVHIFVKKTNNIIMYRFIKKLNEFRINYKLAFLYSSILCVVASIVAGFVNNTNTISIIKNVLNFLVNLVFIYVIVNYNVKNKFYNFYFLLLFTISTVVMYFYNVINYSIVATMLLALLLVYIYNKFKHKYAFIISFTLFVVFAITTIYLSPVCLYYLKQFAEFIKTKPSLFVVINNIYKLFVSNNLENLIYYSGIGLTKIIDNRIIIGVMECFSNYDNNDLSVANFLSSHYVVNIFVVLGLLLNIYNKIDNKTKLTFLIVCFSTIISGNNLIISLFLLLLNPLSYFSYLFLYFLANIIISSVEIKIGFLGYPSIIELLKYIEKPIYFMVIGIVFICLSYYLFELVFEKFNAQNDFYFDKNAKRIITSLGGLKNIERIEDDIIIVKNPNLINILKLDCEIYNNNVILLQNDLIVLKDYF